MPHVIVKLYPGRSEEQKKKLADHITRAVTETLNCGEDAVSVGFEEITAEDWMAKVYQPDIREKPGAIYKQPGYDSA